MPNQEERPQRPRQPVGPDGSWSWMVAVACSWNLLWSSLIRRSTGVIYVALVRTFGATREQTSWVLSVGTSLAWLIGPLVGVGTRRIQLVVLSLLGCLVTAVSAIGCAFARDMTAVFFLLGICSGIGNGIGLPTNDVAIGKYFRRYRGSASGIYYVGGTVAAFAFPPIMNLLLQAAPRLFVTSRQGRRTYTRIVDSTTAFTLPPGYASPLVWRGGSFWSSSRFFCGWAPPLPGEVDMASLKWRFPSVEYGFLGTFLITGGLMLNAVAACPFYRAPPWEYKKKPKVASKGDNSKTEVAGGVSGEIRRESAVNLEQPEQVATIEGTYKAVIQADIPSAGAEHRNGTNHVEKRAKPLLNGASILENSANFSSYTNASFFDHHQVEDAVVTPTDDGSGGGRAASDTFAEMCEFPSPSSLKRSSVFCISFRKRNLSGGSRDEPPCSQLDDARKQEKVAAKISGSVNSAVPQPLKSAECYSGSQAELALYDLLDGVVVDGGEDHPHLTPLPLTIAERSSSPWAYLRSPVFYMMCITCAFTVYNHLVLMILVDLAMEKGFTRKNGAMFISVSAIGDACSRVLGGVLSDRPFCDRRALIGTSALLAGAVCVALPHMCIEYYALAVAMCALFGLCNGVMVVLFGPVLADQLGVESLGLSCGTCRFAMGISYLACPKITGYFKDKIGSYDGLLYLVSIGCFFVGTMWTVDYVYRLIKRRRARTEL